MCNCCQCKLKEPIQFKIGCEDSPENNTDIYVNPDIKYLKYLVHKNGVGFLMEGKDYDRLSKGGIKLLNGAVFTTSEVYTIIFYN